MTKALRIAIIALCSLLLVLPSLAIPFFRSDDGGAENRYLADYPRLIDGSEGLNRDFDGDFESWLCDHFAFRSQAVRANALMNYRLLHTSVNDSVVAGRGDWLYFSETVPDYTGEGRLTDGELAQIGDNLALLADTVNGRGARLYVAIIPNKSTIYPQFMPGRYAMRGDGGNIERMKGVCEALPVVWIDLVTPLSEAAADGPLVYCKTDTHWNDLGAAIAARTILTAMGRSAVSFDVRGETDFSGGDLARLMGAPRDLTERVPEVIPDHPLPDADFQEHRLACAGNGEGALLVYRDSFGTAIGPWLVQPYGDAELLWTSPLDATRPCDDALLLICERNLREYLLEPPRLGEDGGNTDGGDDEEGDAWEEIDGDDDFFSDDEGDDDFFADDEGDEDDDAWEEIDGDDDFFSDDEEEPGATEGRASDGI